MPNYSVYFNDETGKDDFVIECSATSIEELIADLKTANWELDKIVRVVRIDEKTTEPNPFGDYFKWIRWYRKENNASLNEATKQHNSRLIILKNNPEKDFEPLPDKNPLSWIKWHRLVHNSSLKEARDALNLIR